MRSIIIMFVYIYAYNNIVASFQKGDHIYFPSLSSFSKLFILFLPKEQPNLLSSVDHLIIN